MVLELREKQRENGRKYSEEKAGRGVNADSVRGHYYHTYLQSSILSRLTREHAYIYRSVDNGEPVRSLEGNLDALFLLESQLLNNMILYIVVVTFKRF